MKERGDLIDPITAPFDGLDLVVESFNKAAGNTVIEVVENVAPILFQGLDETVVTANRTGSNLGAPCADGFLGLRDGVRAIENRRQLFSESVGPVQQR